MRVFTARVRSTWPGTPPRGGVPDWGTPPGGVRVLLPGGVPDRVPPRGGPGTPLGGTWLGTPGGPDTPPRGGYLTGYPPEGGGLGTPPGGRGYLTGTPPGGVPGTQVGQQKEYSLHGGRYASCVHAGGLSCFKDKCYKCFLKTRTILAKSKHFPIFPDHRAPWEENGNSILENVSIRRTKTKRRLNYKFCCRKNSPVYDGDKHCTKHKQCNKNIK